jgi:hypothetical protein
MMEKQKLMSNPLAESADICLLVMALLNLCRAGRLLPKQAFIQSDTNAEHDNYHQQQSQTKHKQHDECVSAFCFSPHRCAQWHRRKGSGRHFR